MEWHSFSCRDAVGMLKSDADKGLSRAEAKRRLQKYGKNALSGKKKQSIVVKFLMQFSDFMVLILLAAAAVSFGVAVVSDDGDFIDPIMILLIVILNAVIGTVQECRAQGRKHGFGIV